MKIFLDTAELDEIRTTARRGVLERVTTNPTLFAKAADRRSYEDILREVTTITAGPVSAEVVAEDVDGMIRQARTFAAIAPNIFVKIDGRSGA
jgi:transaldolase